MIRKEWPRCGVERWEGKTSAGLPVFVFPMPGFQTKYAILATRFGGCDRRFRRGGREWEAPAGIAHYLEHKMFDMPDYNAAERLSALGASPNAYTGDGMTGYLFSCTQRFEECLEELLRFVTTPSFTPEGVDKERGIITQEIKMAEDDPERQVDRNLFRALYRDHPIRDPIVGTLESVASITADTLNDCHRAFYTPGNMALCCAGDIDPEKVMELAEKLTPPGGEAPARDYGSEEDPSPASVRVEERMEVSMPLFQLGAKLPWKADCGEFARDMLLADLSCELLLGPGSPLYAQLYQEGVINQSFYVGTYDFPHGGVLYAGGRCPDPMAVLGRITDAAEAFTADRETEARLERLKRARLGGFLMSLDAPEDLPDMQVESYFGGWERMELPAMVDSVGIAEAERFLKEMFRPQRLALSVIAPLGKEG